VWIYSPIIVSNVSRHRRQLRQGLQTGLQLVAVAGQHMAAHGGLGVGQPLQGLACLDARIGQRDTARQAARRVLVSGLVHHNSTSAPPSATTKP